MRSLVISAVLVLLAPVAARAEDPLLSGYGGPGGGEQVILGSTLSGAAKGSGHLRAATVPAVSAAVAPQPSAGSGPGAAAAGSAATSAGATVNGNATPSGPATGASRRSSSAAAGVAGGSGSRATGSVTARDTVLVASAPAAAKTGGDSSGFPLSGADIALLLAGLAAVALAGITAARLHHSPPWR
jgi:hypothetical protein